MPLRRKKIPTKQTNANRKNNKNSNKSAIKDEELDKDPKKWSGHIIRNKDDYVLINKLGLGSYASVWMCYGTKKKKLFAIKIFNADAKKSGKKEQDLYDRLEKLNIRNIVIMYDKFIKGERVFIVFDLMVGSLYDMIKSGGCTDGSDFKSGFSVDFIIKITKCVLETLHDLHENKIIHGDVKPENILLHGQNKFHENLLGTLLPKSSTKKISEIIKDTCRDLIEEKSSDKSSENSDSNKSNNSGDSNSDDSAMSKTPVPIKFSDEDTKSINEKSDNNSDDQTNDQTNDQSDDQSDDINDTVKIEKEELEALEEALKYKKRLSDNYVIDDSYIESPVIKLADLGSCVDISPTATIEKPLYIQTKYYRAPEIIIGLEYDDTCDIWALGCTIYELLTGKILFDPDNYDIDKKRSILHQMYASIGKLPKDLIEQSQFKQVFFTENFILKENSVYGNELYEENIWVNLLQHMDCGVIKKYLLLDLLLEMLKMDHRRRITAKDALNHPLFN